MSADSKPNTTEVREAINKIIDSRPSWDRKLAKNTLKLLDEMDKAVAEGRSIDTLKTPDGTPYIDKVSSDLTHFFVIIRRDYHSDPFVQAMGLEKSLTTLFKEQPVSHGVSNHVRDIVRAIDERGSQYKWSWKITESDPWHSESPEYKDLELKIREGLRVNLFGLPGSPQPDAGTVDQKAVDKVLESLMKSDIKSALAAFKAAQADDKLLAPLKQLIGDSAQVQKLMEQLRSEKTAEQQSAIAELSAMANESVKKALPTPDVNSDQNRLRS